MSTERVDFATGADIPEFNVAIVASRCQSLSVDHEGQAANVVCVPDHIRVWLKRRFGPQSDNVVIASSGECFAIGGKTDGQCHSPWIRRNDDNLFGGRQRPNAHRAVLRGAGQLSPVWVKVKLSDLTRVALQHS